MNWPQLIYLLMALLLVSGAGYGFWRFRHDGRNALISIMFWALLLIAVAATYALVN